MNAMNSQNLKISDKTFYKFSNFIFKECGINLQIAKKIMLSSRLSKRLKTLNFNSFEEYYDYLGTPYGRSQELSLMIDAVTTNKTDFFRESKHFSYLTQAIIPDLIESDKYQTWKKFNIWSAGCSTGEEPYTIAMVLSELEQKYRNISFSILGTDICLKALNKAVNGIYHHDQIDPIPGAFRKKYLLKSKDNASDLVRITPQLRSKIEFKRLNFMDANYKLENSMDVIFCRNVLIYFDKQTQETILKKLCNNLSNGGYLFTGHSETLSGFNLPLTPIFQTIYKKHTSDSDQTFKKERKKVYLHIGELYASRFPCVIRTVLGSCVAVCLFDPKTRIGGMNHIFLPGKADLKYFDSSARYGINAMELLINKIVKLGGVRKRFVAKVFGGSGMIPSFSENIGQRNIEFAVSFLKMENIPTISHSLGGNDGRVILFYPDTGDVFVKKIQSNKTRIVFEEQKNLKKIQKMIETTGDVTLF
ncbi:MAG: hypothetical protein HQK76_05380 [Desulfobacterales bacterium]|nr:hypothetical protein [Desulfobacterales bacterium]